MPSNPNIALSVKGPQFRSPLDAFARAQAIGANMMAMQKAQREAASTNALRDYYKGGGKLATAEDIQSAAQAGVDPTVAQKIAEQNLNFGKFGAEQKKIEVARLFDRLGAVAEAGEQGDSAPWVDWLTDYGSLGAAEQREASAFLNISKGKYSPSIVHSLMAGAVEYFKKTTPQAATEKLIGEGGQVGVLNRKSFGPSEITIPNTYRESPARTGEVEVEPFVATEDSTGGTGGPYISAAPKMMPGAKSPRFSADLANPLLNVRNNADYQEALRLIGAKNPDAAKQLRRLMPVFDPSKIEGIRAAALAEFENVSPPAPQGLVAGERGGVGGPLEPTTPFRVRVPAPPAGPQPRETPQEVYLKEKARIDAQRNAPPPKPAPLTEAQRLQRRDALAGEYRKAQGLLDKTYGEGGIIDAVNAVRNLSRLQKEAITGYSAYAPSVFSSSKDADTAVKNLQGTVTELGKEAAAASGAIGSMAVQEWAIVRNMIVNLDLEGMTAEALDNQLNIIEAKAKNAAKLTQRAFEAQYGADLKTMPEFRLNVPNAGARSSSSGGRQYPVLTPEQVRKAPSGTKYYTTDGRFGEKP